jgi:hypothetical protein
VRRRSGGILTIAAAAASLSLLFVQGSVSAASPMLLRVMPSPNHGSGPNSLAAVAALSATDAWSVGVDSATANGPTLGLAEHWKGTAWHKVGLPQPPGGAVALTGVAGSGANDVWAVGYHFVQGNGMTLAEHWNGSAWAIVPSPNVGGSGFFLSVFALTPNQAWAVGFWDDNNGFPNPLVEHWDGASWAVQPAPATGSFINQLNGVTAISTTDVWAVGLAQDPESAETDALIEHYDGSAWTIVKQPVSRFRSLSGVAGTSSHDVWAVGSQFGSAGASPSDGLVEHWDGVSWSAIPSPDPAAFDLALSAVVAHSATDAWAVGWSHQSSSSPRTSEAEHWDGAQWRPVLTTGLGVTDNALFGVTEAVGGQVFGAGVRATGAAVDRTLVVANCPLCAR